ncbi:MAG TPA: HEAT repeat domain-containing protein, partial [Gemmataceae bacterium]|nr:HEAT repeat domain-containing protein [Gemmataceae bacterium]
MSIAISSRSAQPVRSLLHTVARSAVLLVPGMLLLIASLRVPGQSNLMLWLGTAFQFLCCSLSFLTPQGRRQPLGPAVITLYVIALGWLWLGHPNSGDWYFHLVRAVLVVVPLGVFAWQILSDSGATALRRAQVLARRLAARRDWPADLNACRSLPEVKALREALHVDATPALALLTHSRPEVRVAALAALEYRQNWQPGQAEMILRLAQHAEEPAIRAAAVTALANLEDRILIEMLAEFLRDPSYLVRQAATEALLWDSERRWPWIAHAVRRSLADHAFKDDGPLRHEGQLLPPAAVADLTAWAAEKGIVSIRAALTLGVHYNRALAEQTDDRLVQELRRQVADPHTPPALRIELVRILQHNRELDSALVKKLLDAANPAPIRLVAIEELLAEGDHPEAVAALRDLARLPNREIALAVADVVQRRLGVDLG